MEGVSFGKLKDEFCEKLTDVRLRYYAKEKYPWVDRVYKELSGHIHFSNKHMWSILVSIEDPKHNVNMFVGEGNKNWPEEELITFLKTTIKVVQEILLIIKVWAISKEEKFVNKIE